MGWIDSESSYAVFFLYNNTRTVGAYLINSWLNWKFYAQTWQIKTIQRDVSKS